MLLQDIVSGIKLIKESSVVVLKLHVLEQMPWKVMNLVTDGTEHVVLQCVTDYLGRYMFGVGNT